MWWRTNARGASFLFLTLRPYENLCGGGGASSPHCLGGPFLAFKMPMEAPGGKPSQEPTPNHQAPGRRESVVSEPCKPEARWSCLVI